MSPYNLRPITLRFASAEVERAFLDQHARRSLTYLRLLSGVGIAQFLAFAFLDRALTPEVSGPLLLVRLGVCAVLGAQFASTFAPGYPRRMQAMTGAAGVAVGGGAVALGALSWGHPGAAPYEIAVALIVIYDHVLLRLRFVVASGAAWATVAAYLAVAMAGGRPPEALLTDAFILVAAGVTGMVASYAQERSWRGEFASARALAERNEELARTLRDLRETQDRLVQHEKLAGLGRVAAGVAHEIKNPLNFVTNFARLNVELAADLDAALSPAARVEVGELLADLRTNTAKVVEHGGRADAIVRRMGALVSGAAEPRRAIALNALIARLADGARERAVGVALTLELAPNLPDITAAPAALGQAVEALLANALDAVRARAQTTSARYQPEVRLRTRRTNGGIALEVADNGAGIPADIRLQIFEPFFTTKPAGEGTGLGLALAYEVVTAGHGGTITVESAEGVGTTFIVTLPVEVGPSHVTASEGVRALA